jgi:3-hydroxyisobutyrate dehydrogenase-like beta-hydroxyacid dehydrogenase
MKVGFIGLGKMGGGMAATILKAGHVLFINDLQQGAAKPLLEAGASWADSPKSVAESTDMVLTSLPGPAQVEAVALGEDGIVKGIRPGGVYIDLSSNSPKLIRHIYDVFKEKGADVMDAPVSGGPEGARTGKLTLMVGGDEEVFRQCKPVLDVIGDKVNYTGKIGSGSICKLMHNCISYGFQSIIAECFTLGVKAGVEPEALWRSVSEGGVGKGGILPKILPETYLRGHFDPPRFALKLAFKDVNLATSLGREYNVPMPMADLTLDELMSAMNRGWGDKDARIAMLLQEERAGIKVRFSDKG